MKLLAWILSIICFLVCTPIASFISLIVFKSFYGEIGIYNIVTYVISILCGIAAAFELAKNVFFAIDNKKNCNYTK